MTEGAQVIDTRMEIGFGAAHVPGSQSICLNGLASFAGWYLNYDSPILLVNETNNPEEAVRILIRLGFDNVAGYLSGGKLAWHMAGRNSAYITTLTVQRLCNLLDKGEPIWLLDVRSKEELISLLAEFIMELADIGKTFRRLDYETKVTGRAQYLADMSVPGMLHGKILRSPFPHARIKRIDASKARQVPGVVAVITRDDILHDQGIEPFYGPVFKDQTIVATEKVRHVGDPVAAAAALTVDAADEALRSIEVTMKSCRRF